MGGIGVYGYSTNGGFGFVTPSNVQQARGMGGWVKAMAIVDPFAQGGIAVTRCYNSQASGATVWTPPCGISITPESVTTSSTSNSTQRPLYFDNQSGRLHHDPHYQMFFVHDDQSNGSNLL